MSFTSVDLPEPETPVTQVSRPTGKATLTFFRLLPVAPTTRISCRSVCEARCAASRAARRSAAGLCGKREGFLPSLKAGFFTAGSQAVRCFGTSIFLAPERYWPVSESGLADTSA
ncbi:hypothetical protein D9M68_932850 [compost metagenome]